MSRETDALIGFVKAAVPDAVVTATVGHYVSKDNPCSPHTALSMHCADGTDGKGLAVDWGGTEAQQAAVFNALKPVAKQMAELFHNGSGITQVVKNGQWRDGLATLGTVTWRAHNNHTHSAVLKGTFLTPAVVVPPPVHVETVPIPVHDYEEAAVKTTMMHIGPLDSSGNGYGDWQPGLGRDPIPVAVTLLGPSPPDDNGYWPGQAKVTLAAQPRGGVLRVVVRNGTPGDTVSAFVTVA